ncbi:Dabb family protein [Microbacterium suwonense]|uniref:Stress-response A/B barrel domain-containing protein n=1 Tax=Microbacterium suwonense TaxID=683047 RepID=A0ABM8FUK8_9MICO|nr:Dabb family protein [Microbacterium suwonense]BDZ39315.1 hypothetical protein GCM10025863_19290 [Microbacterium suwonense]
MIAHLAIVQYDPKSAELTALHDICADINALSALPGVVSLSAGVARGADGALQHKIALYGVFEDQGRLAAYLAHPDHVAVSARIHALEPVALAGADFPTG